MKEMPKRAWLRRPKEDETRTNANVIGWQDYRGWEDETLYIRADLFDALVAENKRLRTALEVFADKDSWRDMKDGGADPWDGRLFDTWGLDSDPVEIARAALAQEDGE